MCEIDTRAYSYRCRDFNLSFDRDFSFLLHVGAIFFLNLEAIRSILKKSRIFEIIFYTYFYSRLTFSNNRSVLTRCCSLLRTLKPRVRSSARVVGPVGITSVPRWLISEFRLRVGTHNRDTRSWIRQINVHNSRTPEQPRSEVAKSIVGRETAAHQRACRIDTVCVISDYHILRRPDDSQESESCSSSPLENAPFDSALFESTFICKMYFNTLDIRRIWDTMASISISLPLFIHTLTILVDMYVSIIHFLSNLYFVDVAFSLYTFNNYCELYLFFNTFFLQHSSAVCNVCSSKVRSWRPVNLSFGNYWISRWDFISL